MVSDGFAWVSPGIAIGMADAAPESRNPDGLSQASTSLSNAASAVSDAAGADPSCQDWLAARSNIQAGTSSRRVGSMPVRLHRNADEPAYSTTS